MTRTRSALSLVAVTLTAGLMAGCGGSSKPKASGATTTAEGSSSGSSGSGSATTAPVEVTRNVAKTGWYKGFGITVDTAKMTPGFGQNAQLEVGLTYENLGTETASPPSSAHLLLDGVSNSVQFDNPQIPGAGKAKGTFTADVSTQPTTGTTTAKPDLNKLMDRMTLVYGEAADNQTIIPLDPNGSVQSFQPQQLTVSGQLVQKQILVDLVKGSTDASYATGDKGKGLLKVQIKFSCASDCPGSGFAVGREEFSVKTPDGQSLVADQDSPMCCEALYPGNVYEGPKETVFFKVPIPVKGAYVLTYNHADLKVAPATATITVP